MALKDLFRPAWKHSDPVVRRRALQALSHDQAELVIEMAISDPSPELRLEAAQRLHDEAHLNTVAANHPDPAVRHEITRRLQVIWRDTVLRAASLSACDDLIVKIDNEELLADIVCNADDPSVRLTAVQRVSNPKLLCRIAESPCGKEPGELAVRRIADAAILERLTRNGGNKAVRRLAEKRLKQLNEHDEEMSPEDLRNSELNDLKDEAQRLSTSWNWDYAETRLAELEEDWRRVDPDAEHPSYALFVESREQFTTRYAEFLERQEEERQQAEARRAITDRAESVLSRFEELIGSPAPDVDELARALHAEWAGLPELDADFMKPFAGRFEAVNASFTTDRQELLAEQARLEELEKQVVEAEAIAAGGPEAVKSKGRFEKLAAAAEQAEFRRCDPSLLLARLTTARQALDELVAADRAEKNAVAEANQAALEELCAKAEQLSESGDWRQAGSGLSEIQKAWREAARQGISGDVRDELDKRFKAACRKAGKWLRQKREEEDWERWANLQLKEDLIKKVQALSAEEDPVKVGEEVKAAQARWKEIGGVPRKHAEESWQRFREACDEQFTRTRAYYEAQREVRQENLKKKEELAAQAEAVKDSDDWKATGDQLKALQEQWKEVGPAPHGPDRAVYERFRHACDHFFERLRLHHEEQQAERLDSLDQKQQLCERAESLAESSDWWDTISDLRDVREKWKQLGPAPHDMEQAVWNRLQEACQKFYDRLDAARPAHLEAKQALCQQAEELIASIGDDSSRDDEAAEQLKHLQGQWKEIGPAPQDEEKPLWERFRQACDGFFEVRRERFQEVIEERNQKLARKHELLDLARAAAEGDNYREIADKLKTIQAEWKEIGPIPFREDVELYQEFRLVCNEFFEERDRQFQERRDSLHENLRLKEALCTRVEQINGDTSPTTGGADKALDLADQLRIALEENFILGGETSQGRRHAASEEVRKIQAEWKEIGPVPRKFEQALWRRYRTALDKYYGNIRGGNGR